MSKLNPSSRAQNDRHSPALSVSPVTAQTIGCPFCALACDDLSPPVRNGRPATGGLVCDKARAGFEQALVDTTRAGAPGPRLRGQSASWERALARATELLAAARLPLFHGLLGDLRDSRAALQLAGHFGGVIDHLHGEAVARALSVYQDSGWVLTSLGEARNRADLLVLIGDDLLAVMPRLKEKLIDVEQRLHGEQAPAVIELDEDRLTVLGQARALLAGRPLQSPIAAATELAEHLQDSQYPVFVIGAVSGARAELILRAAAELVRDLNAEGRAALLNLGSGLGELTAQLSAAWHNGFGLRTSFARGYPQQDLQRHAGERLLEDGEADLLIWFSSLSPEPAPACQTPCIVFGHPATRFGDRAPEVFLPVAVPGVHRAGFIHRADGLRMVPLHALVETGLQGSAELCRQLLELSPRGIGGATRSC